jgi:RNA polymerase sigma-70 factor (ECF subfamily)
MSSSTQSAALTGEESVPSSIDDVYRDYAHTVARWAGQLGGNGVDADDVMQEVFLVVSRQLARFRAHARFSTWLFEITRKIAANHRRRHRWRFWQRPAAWTDREPTTNSQPDEHLEQRETIAQFYRALDKLPEKYRTVLVLFEIDGLSTHEIAELRQMNLSTVRVQLGRARERFMNHYRRLLDEAKS